VVGPPGGRLHGITRDMSAISDTSLTLAAIAPFANSPTTVTNIAHTRLQECDRIAAVCTELRKLGVQVEERADGFTIHPAKQIAPAFIATYHDHRVAMSFALVGLKVPGISIEDPNCVAKTFPDYWQRLEALRGCRVWSVEKVECRNVEEIQHFHISTFPHFHTLHSTLHTLHLTSIHDFSSISSTFLPTPS
jgi:hypothetical protein